MGWYAIQIKDSYNRLSQYKEIIERLKSIFLKKEDEFFLPGEGKKDNCMLNYLFIKEENIVEFWDKISQEKFFINAAGYIPIPDSQMQELIKSCEESQKIKIRYGDIVYVENGSFRKLYGIVLKVEEESFEVGFNFCIGPMIVTLKPENVRVEESLFEIWKFPMK